jgi:short-subunit dehydrogenase
MNAVLILGAASDIARAIARAYAGLGRPLILAARDPGRLAPDIADLRIRGAAEVRAVEFDVLATARHKAFLDALGELPGTVVCVVGFMGDQQRSETDFTAAELVMRTNYLGPVSILGETANRMAARGSGMIVGISSVAGDRGRAKNYVYGSAKAGFAAFLSGLRQRLALANSGVRVITVIPGWVRTHALEGMATPGLLTAEPAEVASAILKAEAGRRERIYVRPVWRLVMALIGALPERVFKKLKF